MKDFLKNNGIWILIIAVLLTLITAVLSLTFGGIANPFANLAGIVATPFRNGIHAVVTWTEGLYSDAFERQAMADELEEYKKRVAELEEQARQGEAASRENERLRTLLGLKNQRPDYDLQEATVTARGSTNWSSTLTVNQGSNAGVTAGNCVVDQYGYLVGVIDRVGLNWSTLITVVDGDMEMGALIARTDAAAILSGDFTLTGQGKLKLTYLPEDAGLLPGDTILTSGLLSGGTATYPSGLVVGKVESVLTDAGGMNDYAILTPSTDLEDLEQVFIIKSFSTVDKEERP